MTQQYCLASMAAWLSSTGISHHNLLPHIPSIPSLRSQQQPSPWDCSTVAKLQLPAAAPSRGPAFLSGVCMAAASTLILIPFRLPQISCFTLSLKCFSSDSDNCPNVGIIPLLQFSHSLRAGPVLLTLLFYPLFLCPTEFYVVLYILFHWSGTPVHSQLVFCLHFCVWRCIPHVSVERDVLHVHLLLCHLVLPIPVIFNQNVLSTVLPMLT